MSVSKQKQSGTQERDPADSSEPEGQEAVGSLIGSDYGIAVDGLRASLPTRHESTTEDADTGTTSQTLESAPSSTEHTELAQRQIKPTRKTQRRIEDHKKADRIKGENGVLRNIYGEDIGTDSFDPTSIFKGTTGRARKAHKKYTKNLDKIAKLLGNTDEQQLDQPTRPSRTPEPTTRREVPLATPSRPQAPPAIHPRPPTYPRPPAFVENTESDPLSENEKQEIINDRLLKPENVLKLRELIEKVLDKMEADEIAAGHKFDRDLERDHVGFKSILRYIKVFSDNKLEISDLEYGQGQILRFLYEMDIDKLREHVYPASNDSEQKSQIDQANDPNPQAAIDALGSKEQDNTVVESRDVDVIPEGSFDSAEVVERDVDKLWEEAEKLARQFMDENAGTGKVTWKSAKMQARHLVTKHLSDEEKNKVRDRFHELDEKAYKARQKGREKHEAERFKPRQPQETVHQKRQR